uniref:Uncharacterized protein n=1 Tax=Romanomermis culicivorax TaxID=13658 RepID=A0A915KSK3_ROMCU
MVFNEFFNAISIAISKQQTKTFVLVGFEKKGTSVQIAHNDGVAFDNAHREMSSYLIVQKNVVV